MPKKFKIQTNFVANDLIYKRSSFGFNPDSEPQNNSTNYPSYIGRLADKNYVDLDNIDDVRNQ